MKRFGQHVKALRLGYHELFPNGYVRIAAGGPPWIIEICPLAGPIVTKAGTEYVPWWNDDVLTIMLKTALESVKTPTEHTVVKLDDDGNITKGEEDV